MMMMLVGMSAFMPVLVVVRVFMGMGVPVFMLMVFIMVVVMLVAMLMMMVGMLLFMVMFMFVAMVMLMRQMYIELYAFDPHLLFPSHMQVVTVEVKFLEFVFQLVRVHAQVNQRANEHVAADAAEDIEVEGFHFLGS